MSIKPTSPIITSTPILTKCTKSKGWKLYGLDVPPPFTLNPNSNTSSQYIVLGVDEVARGCLVGPVVAGCVALNTKLILDHARNNPLSIPRIADSKRLSVDQRQSALVWMGQPSISLGLGIGAATVQEIYDHNIQNATYLAMARAIRKCMEELDTNHPELNHIPRHVIIDGNRWQHPNYPEFRPPLAPSAMDPTKLKVSTMIKGDDRHLSIAAASILAKQHRDGYLDDLVRHNPRLGCYNWASNRGYGSQEHITAILYNGITAHHRVKFLRKMFPPLITTAATAAISRSIANKSKNSNSKKPNIK